MLEEQQLAALLIKVAVAASIASILMRFNQIQTILLRDERTVMQRLQLALIFSVIFGAGSEIGILTKYQYQALDLSFESGIIAGLLGGYVSGLVTGICVSLPAMFDGKYMSMPLFAAVGILGGLMHDLAPQKEDVWQFSAFVDLNLYRLLRQALRLNRRAIQRRILELATFNVVCSAIIVLGEFARWEIYGQFKDRNTLIIFQRFEPFHMTPGRFAALAVTTLFSIALPVRIWSSFRTERQLEAERVHLTEARLAALTNQINPHFLFNTLNSITTLIRIDPDKARSMIYKLSNILRRLLRKTENFSLLQDEISFIDDYLAIEMVRFGDKLRFEKEIEPATADRLVPSMILQPIIENSIRHGLASKVEGGTIRLRTSLSDSKLIIFIEDNGAGIEASRLARLFEQGDGVGVSNVNERLRVLFGPGYRMLIDSEPGVGTRTLIEIPALERLTSESLAPLTTSSGRP